MPKKVVKLPEVVCGILVVNNEGEILIIKSPKWKNCFIVPGGHIEYGEKIRDAAEREILEEVGIKAKFVKLIIVQDVIFPKEFYKRKHFVSLGCLCKALSSEAEKDGKEVSEIIWVRPEKALKLKLYPHAIELIKRYLKIKCQEK